MDLSLKSEELYSEYNEQKVVVQVIILVSSVCWNETDLIIDCCRPFRSNFVDLKIRAKNHPNKSFKNVQTTIH